MEPYSIAIKHIALATRSMDSKTTTNVSFERTSSKKFRQPNNPNVTSIQGMEPQSSRGAAYMRNSIPNVKVVKTYDAEEEKRDYGKTEKYKIKRSERCNSIVIENENDVKNLEEYIQSMGVSSPSGIGQTTSLVFSLRKTIGCLINALKVFEENNINVVHIESRKSQKTDAMFELYVEFETDYIRLQELIKRLKKQVASITLNEFAIQTPPHTPPCLPLSERDLISVSPWFPKTVYDLDKSANRVLMYGTELDADHPGFTDKLYRQRREYFTKLAMNYKHGEPIPRVEYTDEERGTWGTVFRELTKLYPTHACREYLSNWPLLKERCGYREDNIPQLQDVSEFLKAVTGFTLRPVAGYLSSRDFLAGLAFRVFHCTQYIRHGSDPLYTPEPDCCHELMGHIPLLADPSFAQFSQELGLSSLGASDEEVAKLATCYFFSVEFGLCKQDGELRVYGAGLLSSISELKHALTDKAVKRPFEPQTTCQQECLITTFQDVYFYTESFEEAKEHMRKFASTIKRPFAVRFNPYTQSVDVLDNTRCIGYIVSEVKGELCIVSDALRRVHQMEKAQRRQLTSTKSNDSSIEEK